MPYYAYSMDYLHLYIPRMGEWYIGIQRQADKKLEKMIGSNWLTPQWNLSENEQFASRHQRLNPGQIWFHSNYMSLRCHWRCLTLIHNHLVQSSLSFWKWIWWLQWSLKRLWSIFRLCKINQGLAYPPTWMNAKGWMIYPPKSICVANCNCWKADSFIMINPHIDCDWPTKVQQDACDHLIEEHSKTC